MANEKRLIDANALQLEPDPWGGMNGVLMLGRSGGKTIALVQSALKRMIDAAPTVDAVEVVHGRWRERRFICMDSEVMIGYRCSECKLTFDAESNYCPNCGAKMDGDGNG